ncbi:hypothetical protein BFC17_19195 [Alteromonas lipolytica]|uniref:DUF3016 domain-containing protein n=1 Tax=Alteromonas lipolytica TaxID=1856405 RepID=A0A1E8FE69_9ALTE|nr:hypothetical protein BFC17_19195 [Alteromonas lipolytica]
MSKVKVTWQDPAAYRDIRPSNESRKGFRNRVFKSLSKYLNELAEALPQNETLSLTVTDLDLAGEVWPTMRGGAADIRVVDTLYFPRMEFSYELKQGDKVVKSAQVDLKEMAFMNRISRARSNDALRYEKDMLKRWFDEEFQDTLAKN